MWLTHSTEPGATLEAMRIAYVGEDFYNARVLMHEGVPAEAIHVLDAPIINTADEIVAVSAALEDVKGRTVIIVTSKVHTRRVQNPMAPARRPPRPGHCARCFGRSF